MLPDQVEAAAKSVHAPVMDPEGKLLDPDGDAQLRGSYSANMVRLMKRAASRPVQDIVDLGCATGAVPSHHITSHHITSHHITSHHITSHHITSHQQRAGLRPVQDIADISCTTVSVASPANYIRSSSHGLV
jgi:hypothetical protein